jgi:glycosyltransferase
MMQIRPITIIVPSFNDLRILRAIQSIHDFDDTSSVSILIIDGGSRTDITNSIRDELTSADILISEPDEGIFDGFNKGLDKAKSEIIGWLGSDDFFSSYIRSSDVIEALKDADLFVGNTKFFRNENITRQIFGYPSKFLLGRLLGLHNPHFSTFGRSELLKKHRFNITNRGADIEYFNKIFDECNKIQLTNKVITYMAVGGFSNGSIKAILKTNAGLVNSFGVFGSLSVISKLMFKILIAIYYKIRNEKMASDLFSKYVK